ncbi:MAG: potassium transporter Kup [Bacteroidetes bacterium]|nr:MAG: potassium transporter Kup [Bacteroidota bacterium]
MDNTSNAHKLSVAGLLVTLGIIYGDIGTSPLYVMKAIVGQEPVSKLLILGSISCIFWTLTFQTTIKYVMLTLRADNKGEGGIFSLYTLVRKRAKWLLLPAIVGGATLLADGIITPAISVTSAVEGLELLYPDVPVVTIVVIIISVLSFFQRFGTSVVGNSFGPIMMVWFSMLGVLGMAQIVHHPEVLAAFNPVYAVELLTQHPGGFLVLGAVFLCTTGAEALYSDLGHCGKLNIRVSWIFVKAMLIINYLGQGAWLVQFEGQSIGDNHPFYGLMPDWFLGTGVVIATLAAIIASQALISGSFTLIGEAIRLNLYPRVQVLYPTNFKGQLYIPSVNLLLWLGCVLVVVFFQESQKMEAAYGLSITITMLMTTILLANFLIMKRWHWSVVALLLLVYVGLEVSFFAANIVKFWHGGYVTILLAGGIIILMATWYRAHQIKFRLTDYVNIHDYVDQLKALSVDKDVPKYATHLVFLSNAVQDEQVEHKMMYSILQKQPKRADIYWFVHIEVTDEPYTMEYKVINVVPDDVVRITFRLGFRVEQRISLFLRMVIGDMCRNGEIDITSQYTSLRDKNITGDFRFVIIEEFLSFDNDLPPMDKYVMNSYFSIKALTATPDKWFGLDTSSVVMEKVPLIIRPASGITLKRIPA